MVLGQGRECNRGLDQGDSSEKAKAHQKIQMPVSDREVHMASIHLNGQLLRGSLLVFCQVKC